MWNSNSLFKGLKSERDEPAAERLQTRADDGDPLFLKTKCSIISKLSEAITKTQSDLWLILAGVPEPVRLYETYWH